MTNNKFICYNSPWGRTYGMDWLGWPAAWLVYADPLVASVPLLDWQDRLRFPASKLGTETRMAG